ncbi:MAG: hypothetical protein AAF802_33525, partial [Planctomycetota bacterium]
MSEQRFYADEIAYDDGNGSPDEVWSYKYDAYGREVEATQTLFTSPRPLTGEGPGIRAFTDREALAQPIIRTSTNEYDDQGRWITSITPEGQINYRYDDLGRKTLMSVGDPVSPDRATTYGYDELGRLASVTEHDFIGDTNAATPQASSQSELTSQYFYDLLGSLDGELNANGVFTDYVYDQLSRLDKMTSYQTDGSDQDIADLSDNQVISEFDYEVRSDGRRTRLDESIRVNGQLQTSSRTYDYDQLGRLVRETLDSDFDNTLDHIIDYEFDGTGNRVRKSIDSNPVDTNSDGEITIADTPAFDEVTDYTFNVGDQLIEEVITDAAGAVLGRTTHDYDGTHNVG